MQLSFLVHPDKNPDDRDRAQRAFEGRIGIYLSPETFLLRPVVGYLVYFGNGRYTIM